MDKREFLQTLKDPDRAKLDKVFRVVKHHYTNITDISISEIPIMWQDSKVRRAFHIELVGSCLDTVDYYGDRICEMIREGMGDHVTALQIDDEEHKASDLCINVVVR
jgi:hypothetical protein